MYRSRPALIGFALRRPRYGDLTEPRLSVRGSSAEDKIDAGTTLIGLFFTWLTSSGAANVVSSHQFIQQNLFVVLFGAANGFWTIWPGASIMV
jgi:hypothetical protein